jgi:hypothetical protein
MGVCGINARSAVPPILRIAARQAASEWRLTLGQTSAIGRRRRGRGGVRLGSLA